MALKKRGKVWYAYFRTGKRIKWVSLQTESKEEASALEARLMLENRNLSKFRRANALLEQMQAEQRGEVWQPKEEEAQKRIPLAHAMRMLEKYSPPSEYSQRAWATFLGRIKRKYFDEVTEKVAFAYLDRWYKGENGKSYNSHKGALNRIFRTLEMETGMPSPFAKIPARRVVPLHQRAFTEEECQRIIQAAREPFKSAFVISYYTGLRLKDALNVRWADFQWDILTVMPAKTSAFKRSVRLRVPSALLDYLATLPKAGKKVLDAFPPYNPLLRRDSTYFGHLLESLGIVAGEGEIVCFNSVRDTYVSRLASAGVSLSLIGGAVGHRAEEQTRLYNTSTLTSEQIEAVYKDSVKIECE